MPTGYKYREYREFPDLQVGTEWQSTVQTTIKEAVDNSCEPQSIVRLLGESEHSMYWKYRVHHETIRSMKVRFQDQIRDHVTAIEEFHLFMAKDGTHLFADTRDRNLDELFRRMHKDIVEFRYASRTVDLARMRTELQMQVRGGWFKGLKIADVQSAAIFGSHVGGSQDWQRYESSGTVASLLLEFTYAGEKTNAMISRDGDMVLYQNLCEGDSLDLLKDVCNLVGQFATMPKDW